MYSTEHTGQYQYKLIPECDTGAHIRTHSYLNLTGAHGTTHNLLQISMQAPRQQCTVTGVDLYYLTHTVLYCTAGPDPGIIPRVGKGGS